MQTTILSPEPQVDARPTASRNLTAPLAVVAGVASLGLALATDATLLASGVALLALLLGISALTRAEGRLTRMVSGVVAILLSLGSIGTMAAADGNAAALAGQVVTSEVASPVELKVGSRSTNAENETTTVTVTVKNVSEQSLSTWASISATSPKGKKVYASQGVGVRDLEPGSSSTQQITFGAVLPEKAVFVVTDVL